MKIKSPRHRGAVFCPQLIIDFDRRSTNRGTVDADRDAIDADRRTSIDV